MFNEEMPNFVKTISTHTWRIVENSVLGAIMGKYDPWMCEKQVDKRKIYYWPNGYQRSNNNSFLDRRTPRAWKN